MTLLWRNLPGLTAATRCLSVKESNHNNCAVPDMGDGILRCPVIRKPVMKNAGNKKAGNKSVIKLMIIKKPLMRLAD